MDISRYMYMYTLHVVHTYTYILQVAVHFHGRTHTRKRCESRFAEISSHMTFFTTVPRELANLETNTRTMGWLRSVGSIKL